uniref:HNH endonuclease signature motif containing protein n=1 Tax=Nesterenkonia sp. TaxID=704201 RepID=UPI00261B538B
ATEAEAGTGAGRDGSRKPVRIVKLDRTTSKNLQNLLTTQNPEQITQFVAGQLAGGKNLLEAASTGRFATGTLRTAIQLRDRTCQAYQCTEPAYRTEVDHPTSYETGGPTSAANSQLLCRHHHELKSHRLLPELNTSTDPPPD